MGRGLGGLLQNRRSCFPVKGQLIFCFFRCRSCFQQSDPDLVQLHLQMLCVHMGNHLSVGNSLAWVHMNLFNPSWF